MSAWAALLAASRLTAGTAWQLLHAPRTGGAGGTGPIVNDGITALVADGPAALVVADAPWIVHVVPDPSAPAPATGPVLLLGGQRIFLGTSPLYA
jgi:hypothetical protein